MATKGKRFTDAAKRYDREQLHTPIEAVDVVKNLSAAKFDESVEVAVRLGVDPRKADQIVRGTVSLPAGTGKTIRVAVFASGDAAQAARDAGADIVGADDLVEKVSGGFLDFDLAIATPDLMGMVGRLGRQLGPRGLMPNPKAGTVTPDVAKAIREIKAGRVEFRVDKNGVVHAPTGRMSFTPEQLLDNVTSVLAAINRAKPASSKGIYLKSCYISSTMGPSFQVDPNDARSTA